MVLTIRVHILHLYGTRIWSSLYPKISYHPTGIGHPQVRLVHGDVIKWKHFPRYWPFVRGIHRSPVDSPLKGQWRGALVFSLICAWTNGWVNNRDAGDLRRHRAHYDVTVMVCRCFTTKSFKCIFSDQATSFSIVGGILQPNFQSWYHVCIMNFHTQLTAAYKVQSCVRLCVPNLPEEHDYTYHEAKVNMLTVPGAFSLT